MSGSRPRDDVVDHSPEAGIRIVVATLRAAADDAAARLASARDPEALHDFRVALRRLRSTLRAYRPWIGALIGGRVEKKLKRCARATNAARDIEVQLAWLDVNARALPDRDRPGVAALRALLQRSATEGVPLERVLERYRRASERLRDRLPRRARREPAAGEGERFGDGVATLVIRQLGIVLELAGAIRSARDDANIHRTRIEAKRLRYVLEPFRGNRRGDARAAVRGLRQLQDLLGELHDLDVLADWVRRARREADADEVRPGLASIERLSATRRRALFAELERSWREDGLPALAREVEGIAGAFRAIAAGSTRETVRRGNQTDPAGNAGARTNRRREKKTSTARAK